MQNKIVLYGYVKMLFRIEDVENCKGIHRDYVIYYDTKNQKQEFDCYSLYYAILSLCKTREKYYYVILRLMFQIMIY